MAATRKQKKIIDFLDKKLNVRDLLHIIESLEVLITFYSSRDFLHRIKFMGGFVHFSH